MIEQGANHILANGDVRGKTEYSAFAKNCVNGIRALAFPADTNGFGFLLVIFHVVLIRHIIVLQFHFEQLG